VKELFFICCTPGRTLFCRYVLRQRSFKKYIILHPLVFERNWFDRNTRATVVSLEATLSPRTPRHGLLFTRPQIPAWTREKFWRAAKPNHYIRQIHKPRVMWSRRRTCRAIPSSIKKKSCTWAIQHYRDTDAFLVILSIKTSVDDITLNYL